MPVPSFSGAGGFDSAWFAAYKHVYNPHKVARLAYSNRPFFKMLRKEDMFEGDTYNHTVFFEDPQGGSQTFSTAIAQKAASSQGARFIISRGREYQALTMDNEAIQASRSDKGSLLRKKVSETDRVIQEMSRRIDIALHGSGQGILSSFTTGSSLSNTITLDTPALGIRYSVGMWVQFATTTFSDGTAPVLTAGGQSLQVMSVNRGAKSSTVTFSASLSTISGITTNMQYFAIRSGCGLGFGISNPYGGVSGLRAWLPINGPQQGESFWGFDRSVDAQRLAGTRYAAAAGEKYETTFQNVSAELELQNSNPTAVLMNPVNLSTYSQELGTKARYIQAPGEKAITGLNTSGLIVQGQSGQWTAISDPQVDPGTFYVIDESTWWMATLNGVPHLDTADGLAARREANSDGQEIRWRAWYQLICDAPGKNAVGTFGY